MPVKCHICEFMLDDDPVTITVLNAGEEQPAHAHRYCYERDRTKQLRFAYKHRPKTDRRSFEQWRAEQ
jgi:hypothetical protein